MFLTDYLDLSDEKRNRFRELGIFDCLINQDSHFYINIIRLKNSTIPEFVQAYEHLNQFFIDIATLLDSATVPDKSDVFYREARNRFVFHEVNGINLGFSSSGYGAGWGKQISDEILKDAFQIIKKGSNAPELFHLVNLFEENVGGDRISDMIATIIEKDIISYTFRMMKELEVDEENYLGFSFDVRGLLKNPNKNAPILLLPKEILHELPIARSWSDLDRVLDENKAIKREIGEQVGDEWYRWSTSEKRNYIKNNIFMSPPACNRVIKEYQNEIVDPYNVYLNTDYLAEYWLSLISKFDNIRVNSYLKTSYEAAIAIIEVFKDWVENNRGWAEIINAPSNKREKSVQKLLHLAAKTIVEDNHLDISFESDAGRGPLDVKLSKGSDKTIIEVKLSSSNKYMQGFETQIEEYGKAESCEQLIYLFVDIGNPNKRRKIQEVYDDNVRLGNRFPELVVIDSTEKESASKL